MTTIRTRLLRLVAAGGIIAGAATLPGRAFADCNDYGGGSCGSAGSVPTPTTVGNQTSNVASLPFTGGDVVGLSLVGIGAVTAGTALVRSGRRKAAGA